MAKSSPIRQVSIIDDPAYWQALGKFVEQFAVTETVLFSYVASIVPMGLTVARALLPGTRTAELLEQIRRIWQADEIWGSIPETGLPVSEIHAAQRTELDPVLAQLKAINTVRNSIIHYATFVTSDKGRISSNISRAVTLEGIREHRATPEILGQMTADSNKIGFHLVSFVTNWKASRVEREKNWPLLNDAWQYTPEPDQQLPVRQQKKIRGRRPTP